MTTITLEVPDELAVRLSPMRQQLPHLLSMALELYPKHLYTTPPSSKFSPPVFVEMVDFLAGGPSLSEIITFKVSPAAQARLEFLLDKNRAGELTPEEAAELNTFQQVNHIFILLKARARASLDAAN